VNYGTLLPPRAFNPPAVLAGGAPVGPAVLADRWWLVTVDSSACDKACQYKLVLMRQMRLAQGKDADRIGRLWIVTDPGERADLAPALADGLVLARSAGPAAMAQWLGVADPSARIYLVDPLGNLMMSFPADPDTRRMLRDIERLLRINTWQKIQ
jgi:cytochrome oxidase Cu insertion factor (SCO1/SenC/PrrC family)